MAKRYMVQRAGKGDLKKCLGALLFEEVFMTLFEGLQVPPPSHGLGVGTLLLVTN